MIAYDFKLDENGDLYIDPVTKDLVIVPSDKQHAFDILSSAPGHFKEHPLVGWDPIKRINGRYNKQEGNQAAKTQLRGDGYIVKALNIEMTPSGSLSLTEFDISR